MKQTIQFEVSNFQGSVENLKEAWSDLTNKVFVLKANQPIENVQEYYESNFKYLGTPCPIAEDVTRSIPMHIATLPMHSLYILTVHIYQIFLLQHY